MLFKSCNTCFSFTVVSPPYTIYMGKDKHDSKYWIPSKYDFKHPHPVLVINNSLFFHRWRSYKVWMAWRCLVRTNIYLTFATTNELLLSRCALMSNISSSTRHISILRFRFHVDKLSSAHVYLRMPKVFFEVIHILTYSFICHICMMTFMLTN